MTGPSGPDGPPDGTPVDDPAAWVEPAGAAAAVGAVAWTATPWLQYLVLGDRPYLGTVFDLVSLAGWLLMLGGIAGVFALFRTRFGRLGRLATATAAAGAAVVGLLLLRRVAALVAAGFRAVPATGENPAGLVLSLASFAGLALVLTGAGLLGVALSRAVGRWTPTAVLLLAAFAVPALAAALGLAGALPLPAGRLLVRTNLALVPFGVAWVALGVAVRRRARRRRAGD